MKMENKTKDNLILGDKLKNLTMESLQKQNVEVQNAVEIAYNVLADILIETAQKGLSSIVEIVKFEVDDDKLLKACCQSLKDKLIKNGLTSVTYNIDLKSKKVVFNISWVENQSGNKKIQHKPIFSYHYIKNTQSAIHSSITSRVLTFDGALEAIKDCADWHKPNGTGSIYRCDIYVDGETVTKVDTFLSKF